MQLPPVPARPRVRFLLTAVAAALVLAVIAPAVASASHIKGAGITASIGTDGHLRGTVLQSERNGLATCPYGVAPGASAPTITGPGGYSGPSTAVLGTATIVSCTASSITAASSFDVDLTSQPDGLYTLTFSASARVGGIQNNPSSVATARAKVIKAAGVAHAAPVIANQPALAISRVDAFAQRLAATTDDGSAPIWALLQSSDSANTATYDSGAPTSNIVALSSDGDLTSPLSTTSGLTLNQYWSYKLRVADTSGQSVERDLLFVVTNNHTPQFTPASPSGTVDVTAGDTLTLNFEATDQDVGQTLSTTVGGLPAYGTANVSGGTATVTIAPPADATDATFVVPVEVADSDPSGSLTASRAVTVTVHARPAATPTPTPTETPAPTATPTPTASPTPTPTPAPEPVTPRVTAASSLALSGSNIVEVGCNLAGALIKSCTVDVFADVPNAKAAKLVKIGTGTTTPAKPGAKASVKIKLTAAGRRLVNRAGGVKVVLRMRATTTDGAVLRAQGKSRLLPRTLAIASDGLFASGSSTLSAAGKRFAARTATQLKGAVRITCTGYTDNTGAASFNKALGLARAKAVCAALRKAGLGKKVQLVTRSGGPSHPRAKNDTAAGRAKNRRVELAVRYGR